MMASVKTICCFFLFVGYAAAQVAPPGNIIDITVKHGAKPEADVTAALLAAWQEGCACTAPSTVLVPKGNFLLNNIELAGPCKNPITLRIEGILRAPADPAQMKGEAEWICIRNVEGLTVTGGGTFDGQGKIAWSQNDCAKTGKCSKLPNNLSFNFLTNALIQDVTTLDSKLFHVNVLGCKNITFLRFKVCAPDQSLNTDGIHIGRSAGVRILETEIKTGDDCISVGDGTSQLTIEKVTCGPGHGISVGSLGKYPNEEPVCGMLVKNCTITGTDNGVRIKTWPNAEPGVVTDVKFEDIIMNDVGNPILIDQEYCPAGGCKLENPSKVKISKVSFKNIKGTSRTKEAIKLICSKGNPCEGVEVADVDLCHTGPDGPAISICANVKPVIVGQVVPAACATIKPGGEL